jgi:hypothetical protein
MRMSNKRKSVHDRVGYGGSEAMGDELKKAKVLDHIVILFYYYNIIIIIFYNYYIIIILLLLYYIIL